MKGDAILFGAIVIFLFLLWLYAGGPGNPISFAGPYLTPVTNVGETSDAYGSTDISGPSAVWQSVSGVFSGRPSSENNTPKSDGSVSGTDSSFSTSVSLGGGNTGATKAREEYVTIRNNARGDVNITGWRLKSERTGASAIIDQGVVIARKGSKTDIVLNAGGEAIVTSGSSPIDQSFRESTCTGYLSSSNTYTPSLYNRCPTPLDELGDFYGKDARAYDQCSDYVRTLRSCTEPGNAPKNTPNSCENFTENLLSYNGCVSHHRDDADFLNTTWRVYLDESRELWRSSNDVIDLIDRNGTVVDRYSY